MFGWTWVILAVAAIVIVAAHVLAFALCRAADGDETGDGRWR